MLAPEIAHSLPLPPGPTRRESLRAYRSSPPDYLHELSMTYGDVARWRGPFTIYLISNPEIVRFILTQSYPRFIKDTIDYRVVARTLGRGLVTNEGDDWARQRKLMQPVFSNRAVNGFDAVINDRTATMLQRWHTIGADETVWLEREMSRVTYQVVCATLFGSDIDHYADEIADIVAAVNQHPQQLRSILTLYPWLPIPSNRRFARLKRRLDEIVDGIVAARREQPSANGDIVDRLLAARDENSGQGMSTAQMRDELITLMLAGHETSATALVWTLYLLSRNPEVEHELLAELEQVLGGRAATSTDLANTPYLKQVVQESMRLYPPVWGIARKSTQDETFGDYRIPAQSYLSIGIYSMQRNPAFWHDPLRFDPSRFAPNRNDDRHPYCYIPFSAGPRACIGASMAMLEIQLVLAQILQQFKVTPRPDHPIETHAAVTLKPKHGVPVTLSPR